MTFRNVTQSRNTAVNVKRVLLRRRCLQILTGRARYDFSHGIEKKDLLSDRRVSVTMRESPLSKPGSLASVPSALTSWWKQSPVTKTLRVSSGVEIAPSSEPIPGLFVYYNFITEEEESIILRELDDDSQVRWNSERHTGVHQEKRFGVDHDLWSRKTRPPRKSLPRCLQNILIPRLQQVSAMTGCVPNEVNAIDYRRRKGCFLKDHVDDRKKHGEPIANLSLCGDCYMTYRNTAAHRNLAVQEKKVLLQRRCLQVMTGKARYDFSHGISNDDILSDRRVSVTMRETPLNK